MEELIFFAVIIFFSIVESIARTRKAKRGGGTPTEDVPAPSRTTEYEPPEPDVPTYDADPSYDDRVPSSQTMLPGELLEELAGLAGRLEKSEARTLDLPNQSPPLPEPTPRPERTSTSTSVSVRPRSTVSKRPSPSDGQHRVHLAHVGYGTDPSTRARSEQDGLDPLAEYLNSDAKAIRKQLRSHKKHALRQAVVLQEVLGPPASLKRDRFSD